MSKRSNCLVRVSKFDLERKPAGRWWNIATFRVRFGLNRVEFAELADPDVYGVLEVDEGHDRCRIAAGESDYFGWYMTDRAIDGPAACERNRKAGR